MPRAKGKKRRASKASGLSKRSASTSRLPSLLARPNVPMALLLVLSGIAALLGPPVLNELQLSGRDIAPSTSRSAAASTFLEQNPQLANYRPILIVVRLSTPPRSPQTRRRLDRVIAQAAQSDGVGTVLSYRGIGYAAEQDRSSKRSPPLTDWQRQFFSRDRTWGVVAIPQEGLPTDDPSNISDLERRVTRISGVYLAGESAITQELGQQIQRDLRQAEFISFPAILLLLLTWFRKPAIAVIPLFAGAATLCETLLLVRLAHKWGMDFSLLAAASVAGLALGLSVDYSMLLVSRYREEYMNIDNSNQALACALRAVAPVVATSATIMVFTLAPLSLFSIPLVSSIGMAAQFCAIVAAFNALTLVPILLATYGERIKRGYGLRSWIGQTRPQGIGFWSYVPSFSTRHPKRVAAGVSILLLVLAAPFLSARISSFSDSAIFGDSEAARMTQLVQRQFTESVGKERYVVFLGSPGVASEEIEDAAGNLREVQGILKVGPPERIGSATWKIEAEGNGAIGSNASRDTVEAIEGTVHDLSPFISSPAALLADRDKTLRATLPQVLAISAVFVFLLLFGFTGSFILAGKFLILNALTIAASLGMVALKSQGAATGGALDTAQVVILVIFSLALVTDYGVFVLARILEEHRAGKSDQEAIVSGLAKTGPIVSAAATVFAVALGAFLFSEVELISQFSVGLITAVIVDTTIVRALLVPSSMAWLGRFNWWAPKTALAFRRWLLT
jgi:putative drug exporter of the RND superfamily